MTAEQLDLTDMVEAVDIPCEAKDHHGEERPAEWVVWVVRCCAARPEYGLACNACLRRWLTDQLVRVCDGCGRHAIPKNWITHFELINKPPAA